MKSIDSFQVFKSFTMHSPFESFVTSYPNRRSMSVDESWHFAVELVVVESAATVAAEDPRSFLHKKIIVVCPCFFFRNKKQTN